MEEVGGGLGGAPLRGVARLVPPHHGHARHTERLPDQGAGSVGVLDGAQSGTTVAVFPSGVPARSSIPSTTRSASPWLLAPPTHTVTA